MSSASLTQNHGAGKRADHYRWLVTAWFIVSAFVLVWSGLIIAAPILEHSGHTSLAAAIYTAFRPICHQIGERSFHLYGEQFAVCTRCSGIYFGFAAGVLLYPIFRSLGNFATPSRIWLILSPVPTAIDFALTFFGIWENTAWSRFLTAALFGVIAAIYVVPGLMDLTQMMYQSIIGRKRVLADTPIEMVITGGGGPAPSDYSAPQRRI